MLETELPIHNSNNHVNRTDFLIPLELQVTTPKIPKLMLSEHILRSLGI